MPKRRKKQQHIEQINKKCIKIKKYNKQTNKK